MILTPGTLIKMTNRGEIYSSSFQLARNMGLTLYTPSPEGAPANWRAPWDNLFRVIAVEETGENNEYYLGVECLVSGKQHIIGSLGVQIISYTDPLSDIIS